MAKRRLGFWRRFAVSVIKPPLIGLTARDWRGMEHIPRTGPVILVANHISHADPFVLAHFVYDAGRWPGFLAKASVFRLPVAGPLLHKVGQIPVYRGTVDAAKALDAAGGALRSGEAVLIYPEGTITHEPDLWPMRGKTGVARLWLTTGAPVVPIAMWGPERLYDPRTKKMRLRPRTPITVAAGPPVALSRWTGVAPTPPNLPEITDQIMGAVRQLVNDIRGGEAPPLWSPAAGREATS